MVVKYSFPLKLLYCFPFITFLLLAQVIDAQKTDVKKFSIMPIPYVPGEGNLSEFYEENESYRIALTKIQEAFINRGYNTINFHAKYKKALDDEIFSTGGLNLKEKERLINYASPDIYIETEITYLPGEDADDGDKVQLRLNAYFTATSSFLGGVFCETNRFRGVDLAQLTNRATTDCFDDFISSLEKGFEDLIKNGQPFQLEILIEEGAIFDLNSLFVTKSAEGENEVFPLGNLLEFWIEEHSMQYRLRGKTAELLLFDEVRIPFYKPGLGKVYNSRNTFKNQFIRFLYKLKSEGTDDLRPSFKEESIGNTLYFKLK